MKIAVMGSWRSGNQDYRVTGTKTDFSSACNDLGKQLATSRQTIVVGSHSDSTADLHVVNGYVSASSAESSRPMIEIVRPANSRAYDDLAMQNPGLFSFPSSLQQTWGSAHLVQIRDADAVLTIAGGSSTYHAGLAAIVANKRLVPIGSFGGAAVLLSNSLQALGTTPHSDLGVLNGPWNRHTLSVATNLLGINRKPKLLIIHGHGTDRYILTEWLRSRLGLTDLLIMQQDFGSGQSLPEKFESMAAEADGAIAIATPDDVGGIAGNAPASLRARQNVWIEVGWVWGRLGRKKLVLLCKGAIEIPSDLQGMEHYRYADSPLEVTESLRAFIHQLSSER